MASTEGGAVQGVLFGVGWGLSGFCLGPALVSASVGSGEALAYVLIMGVGMLIGNCFGGSDRHRFVRS